MTDDPGCLGPPAPCPVLAFKLKAKLAQTLASEDTVREMSVMVVVVLHLLHLCWTLETHCAGYLRLIVLSPPWLGLMSSTLQMK